MRWYKNRKNLCLIMQRPEVSDSASVRPRRLFTTRTTGSVRRGDVGHAQRRPNVHLSLNRVARHKLLMGKNQPGGPSSGKAQERSSRKGVEPSSGNAAGPSSGNAGGHSSGIAGGPSSGNAGGPSSGSVEARDKVRVRQGVEEEPCNTWMRGPAIELGAMEGAHWRWTLYPKTLTHENPDDGETMLTYGLIVWSEAFHVELMKRASAGKQEKTITISDIHKLSQEGTEDVLLESWVLPLISSIT